MKIKLSIIFVLLFIPVFIFAEAIYLQDGTIIRGKIINADKDNIVIETLYGSNTIKKIFIKKIEYENLTPVYEGAPKTVPPIAPEPPKTAVVPPTTVKPVLPPTTIVNPPPPPYRPTYYPQYPKNKHNEFFVNLGFSAEDLKNKALPEKKHLYVYGISLKMFEWDSIIGFGININSRTNYPMEYTSGITSHSGKLNWTTFGSTLFFRVPDTSFSPYLGIGSNLHVMKYKDDKASYTTWQGYNYYNISSPRTESNTIDARAGGHVCIGLDIFISKALWVDFGFKYYFLTASDKSVFKDIKDLSASYINVGFMF